VIKLTAFKEKPDDTEIAQIHGSREFSPIVVTTNASTAC